MNVTPRSRHRIAQHLLSLVFATSLLACKDDLNKVYRFPDLSGPTPSTPIQRLPPTPITTFAGGEASRMAVLVTDTASGWLGLANGLTSIGVPFTITRDYREAIQHQVVVVYPLITGGILPAEGLAALNNHVMNGGTIVGFNVLGGLRELFGVDSAHPSKTRFAVRFASDAPVPTLTLSDSLERELPLGDRRRQRETAGTYGYIAPRQTIAVYDDSTAAVTYQRAGRGHAYALGIDLGALFLLAHNGRDETLARTYVNAYEPGIDVWLRLLKAIYIQGEQNAVTVSTVPQGKSLAVVLTHDVDFANSWANAIEFARYERSQGIRATYFVQTKYVRDWNDKIFFSETYMPYIHSLDSLGMELASHSVSHSLQFARFPMGDGNEQYPDYAPFVEDSAKTRGGTILGELRVSKFLLENTGPRRPVVSFRPGDLSNPHNLPEALRATGYRYVSAMSAPNSLTHLPFQLTDAHGRDALSGVYEFPVTVEDELTPPMDARLPQAIALAHTLMQYGGLYVVLIHPGELDHKLRFEQGFVTAVKDSSWFGALGELGEWWAARASAQIDVHNDGTPQVRVTLASPMKGLTLEVPAGWQYADSNREGLTVTQQGRRVVVDNAAGTFTLNFKR